MKAFITGLSVLGCYFVVVPLLRRAWSHIPDVPGINVSIGVAVLIACLGVGLVVWSKVK